MRPFDGNATNPKTRIVIASGRLVLGRRGCTTQVAQYTIPANAVQVVVLEWLAPLVGKSPPRPRRFTARALPLRRGGLECFGGLGGSITFTDHGRSLGAYLIAGRSASRALIHRARATLDSLRVRPK